MFASYMLDFNCVPKLFLWQYNGLKVGSQLRMMDTLMCTVWPKLAPAQIVRILISTCYAP